MKGKIFSCVLAVALLCGSAQAQLPFDPFYAYGGMVLSGRIQNMVASDRYLVVHLVLGPRSEQLWVFAEPDLRLKTTLTFIHIGSEIVLEGDRLAFIASETEPTSASIGLHIFDVSNVTRVSYARLGLNGHSGRYLAAGSNNIVDLQNGAVVFGMTPARFYEHRAVIGDKFLGIVSEGFSGSNKRPVLFSPAASADLWAGRTFPPEVVDFLDRRLPQPPDFRFDGFPVLLAEEPRTKSDQPFRFLLLKESGEAVFLDRAFFGLRDATPYATVDFACTRPSPSGRILVAGINTRHLSPQDGEKMVLATFDSSGAKIAQASIDLADNGIAWMGLDAAQNLVVFLNQYRPRSKNLIARYSLPGLVRSEAECAFDPQVNTPPRIIGSDLFLWTRIRKYPPGTPVPPRATMTFPAVVGLNPADASVTAFYSFDSDRWKLMDFLKERGRHIFNTSHLFLPFMGEEGVQEGSLVLPLPRSERGWLDASFSGTLIVYPDSDYTYSYSPSWASLSVDCGRLNGVKWHSPSQPGTAVFSVSNGAVKKDFTVQIVPRPAPVAHFIMQDFLASGYPWNEDVNFDSRGSSSSTSDGITYSWDFGDGTPAAPASYGYSGHTYQNPGTYTVTLTVANKWGGSTKAQKNLAIGRRLTYGSGVTAFTYGIPAALAGPKTAPYQIEIKTGDEKDAGTKANVYLALYGYKNAEGERQGTGEIHLTNAMDESYRDAFDPGHIDVFKSHSSLASDLGEFPSLDDVEYMILRHDASGGNANWHVFSVRVRNLSTGQEWYFEPNAWLDADPYHHYSPCGAYRPTGGNYPRGILFGGSQKTWKLTDAGDNVYILDVAAGKFYFTELDRARGLEVYLGDQRKGGQYTRGTGVVAPPYIPKPEWGIEYDAAEIAHPTQFKVRADKADGSWDEFFVWVLPSSWQGNVAAAKAAILLYPLKDQTGALSYGDTVVQFLHDQNTFENMLNAALQPIIGYGVSAFGIFGAPTTVSLSGTIQERVGLYVAQGLYQAIKKLGLTLQAGVLDETIGLFKSIIAARDWARQFGGVTAAGAAAAGGVYLLGRMADTGCDPELKPIVSMLSVLKGKLETAIARIDANDPAGFARAMADVKTIALGLNPQSADPADYLINYGAYGITDNNTTPNDNYCLSMACLIELNSIKRWETDDYLPCYPSDLAIPPTTAEMKAESKAAMTTYRPLFENLMRIAGAIIDIALLI
jgi:hypothetical protein